MTATIPSSLRGYTELLPSVAWGAVSVLAWSRFLFSQPLLTSFWVWHRSLTYSACLGIHYFLVLGSLLLFAEYSQSLKMWLLKFHFKDSLYQLIFIGVLPPSALGCRKPPAGSWMMTIPSSVLSIVIPTGRSDMSHALLFCFSLALGQASVWLENERWVLRRFSARLLASHLWLCVCYSLGT